jgi:hypothetical protein
MWLLAFNLLEMVVALRSHETTLATIWQPGDEDLRVQASAETWIRLKGPDNPREEVDGAGAAVGRDLNLCRSHELSDSDLALGTAAGRPGAAEEWRSLFRAWSGKKVLLAGDSLMDQLFQVASCAASLLGGTVDLSNVARLEWVPRAGNPGSKEVSTSKFPFGLPHADEKERENTQATVLRASITVGNQTVKLDYLRSYSLTERCQICKSHQARESCGLCSDEVGYVTPVDALARWAQKYDHTYANLGHDVLAETKGEQVEMKALALAKALKVKGIDDRLVFVEHPPLHYPNPDGTGNHPAHSSGGGGRCQCQLPHIAQQPVSVNNERFGRIARETGIRFAKIFRLFSSTGCERHRPPDCIHYQISPTLWAPVAAKLSGMVRHARHRA